MQFGVFKGDVIVQWLRHEGDDRKMKLLEDISYIDPDHHEWHVPKGSIIDGASIPSALWTSVGAPYVGDYRRASVIHDIACQERTEPYERVHKMFFSAMRADGVSWVRANVMYQAVKRFGPKWSTDNAAIASPIAAKDAEVIAFAQAVAQAASELQPAQSLEAVEARADEILLAHLTPDVATIHPPKPATDQPQASPLAQPVSKIRKVQPSLPSSAANPPAIPVDQLQPAVQKQLASTALLSEVRLSYRAQFDRARMLDANQISESLSDTLTRSDRLRLVDQALVLLEQNYVHRPLKEAMYAVNPVQRLKLLQEKILQSSEALFQTDAEFHRELAGIFLSTRDLHTNYFLPAPFSERSVYLPFLVEDYFDASDQPNQRRYLVTHLLGSFQHPSFVPGVEILRWNGVDIRRAVELNGEQYAGSNPEASRARGIETLTVRSLLQSLPPEEDFVLVEYRTLAGSVEELRVDWLIFTPDTGTIAAVGDLRFESAIPQGIDLEQTLVRLTKKVLFAPQTVATEVAMSNRAIASQNQGLTSLMPNVMQARPVETEFGRFGYIRIRTFSVDDADRFVNEFVRLIEQLPQEGLIIDVRGNGGGLILAGEQLLQVLTPHPIQPTLFQFLNTPLNRQLVETNDFLASWRPSMRQAVQTGAAYSQGLPITSVDKANEVGQRYYGPVVLITDGLCYSTTDIFAAGFQDHQIGVIVGTDNNTGAGGANVWTHDLLSQFLPPEQSPYQALPSNAGMRVSIRRTIRVGTNNGTVLEDLGVVPDQLHRMTKDDLLLDNVDLIDQASQILATQPSFRLKVDRETSSENEALTLRLTTQGIDRVDIYDDARPLGSVMIIDDITRVELPLEIFEKLVVQGFASNKLVARRLV